MFNQQGMSLLETLIALFVCATITGTSIPHIRLYYSHQLVTTDTSLIRRYLHATRESAMDKNHRISICGLNQQGQCAKQGIRRLAIFHDKNRNRTFDASDTILQEAELSGNTRINFRASARALSLTYNPNGYARQSGSFIICSPLSQNDTVRRVSVNRSGRIYNAKSQRLGERIQNPDGSDIVCTG